MMIAILKNDLLKHPCENKPGKRHE